jgi:hypothetical protein
MPRDDINIESKDGGPFVDKRKLGLAILARSQWRALNVL